MKESALNAKRVKVWDAVGELIAKNTFIMRPGCYFGDDSSHIRHVWLCNHPGLIKTLFQARITVMAECYFKRTRASLLIKLYQTKTINKNTPTIVNYSGTASRNFLKWHAKSTSGMLSADTVGSSGTLMRLRDLVVSSSAMIDLSSS